MNGNFDSSDGSDLPSSVGNVARRELAAHGITRLDQVIDLSAKDLLAIHGVGPKAVRILRERLIARGLDLRTDDPRESEGIRP
jgi:predicted flap endonuclease-1-like 5' DNA nuclease